MAAAARPTCRPRFVAVAIAVSAAALVLAAGCSSGDGASTAPAPTTTDTPARETTPPTTEAELPTAPGGDAFYVPPQGPPAAPGEVIWAAEIDDPPPGTRGWRILHGSTTARGGPTAVSGLVFAPDPLPRARPVPVLALAHGTTGLADRCAPSRMVAAGGRSEAHQLPSEVLRGHVVVATDYEGLGTPGVHPYLVGLSEARSVLDSIRAAQRLGGTGAGPASPSIVWGHSQGGGAALVAAELAPSYAPDTNLRGAAAGAPAAELKLLASALRYSPFFGFLFMAAAGFDAAYPDLDLSQVLTPAGEEAARAAGEQCGAETIAAFAGQDPSRYVKADPGAVEPFASVLEENSPGVRATTVPVFLYHGEADEVVPAAASQLVLDRYCRNGTTAFRRTYPGETHGSVVAAARPEIAAFLADRLAGKPAPTSCRG